jgi:surface protein
VAVSSFAGEVVNMSWMFTYAKTFNQDIGDWNVGKVTNMHSMFSGAGAFNQDIGNWDISSLTDAIGMFAYRYHLDRVVWFLWCLC